MKTKVAQSEMSSPSVPVHSSLAMATPSAATKNDAALETQIQELAYKLFEERGRVDGNDQQDWFEAESILREREKLAA